MCLVNADDKNGGSLPEHALTEEKFFEQFAALEESVALLQAHMRDISENAKLFGSLVTHIRRSVCPVTLARETMRPVPRYGPRNPSNETG